MDAARSNTEDIRRLVEMPRAEFEALVAQLYRALGHQAACTQAKGDQSVHIIVTAKNGEKWIVQCRQWRGAIGELVVRDFSALMQREQAQQGALITTATFTPKAREWAKGKPIFLYDGTEFLRAMKRIQTRSPQPQP